MKKTFLFAAAAATALFTACSSDDGFSGQNEASKVNVSFTANLDDALKTRTVSGESDGTQANTLTVAVYNAAGEEIENLRKENVAVTNKTATVDFQLMKGQTYSFAFWAQNSGATAGALTFTPADGKVTVDYTKIKANDQTLDAFTTHEDNLTVTGTIQKAITLKRPWAQVNYGSTDADWNAAVAAGITVGKSKVVVNNVYTTLNLKTGAIEGEATTADITMDAATLPTATLAVSGTTYHNIGLNYLLVGGEADTQSLIKADLEVQKADGAVINQIAFSNVPVQRNYRTNIVGNLLTSKVDFNITVDPMYDGESIVEVWDGSVEEPDAPAVDGLYHITSPAELAGLAEMVNGGETFAGKTVILDTDIDLGNLAWTPIGTNSDNASRSFQGTFNGNDKTISNLNVNLSANAEQRGVGLFGAIRENAILKDFTIAGASVKGLLPDATANGIGVVLGSMQHGGTIENVKVVNAIVEGNHYVGGIAGYGKGTITGCSVDGLNMVVTPDNLGGSYDNGDKGGGILGMDNSGITLTGNTVSDFTIKGYRDLGGIVGCSYPTSSTVTGNTATNGTIVVDQVTNSYGPKTVNAAAIVGRVEGGSLDASSNTSSNVAVGQSLADGLSKNLTTNVISISNANGLVAAANYFSAGGTFVLANDIDMTGVTYESPVINSLAADFVFDGTNKIISNMSTKSGDTYAGLFGKINPYKNVTIKNLTIKDATLNPKNNVDGEYSAGALIGWTENHANITYSIQNVTIDGVTVNSTKYAGGLIGWAGSTPAASLVIDGCVVMNSTIKSAYTEDNGTNYKGHAGGVVGYLQDGTIKSTTVSSLDIEYSLPASSLRAGALAGTAQANAVIGTGNTVSNFYINDTKVTDKVIGDVDNRINKDNDSTVDIE